MEHVELQHSETGLSEHLRKESVGAEDPSEHYSSYLHDLASSI